MGLAGAFLMGGVVFWINLDYGWWPAATAGLKQWLYTFFFGGMIIKLLEQSLKKLNNPYLSISISVLFVSTITTFLVFLVHNLKGTPEPFLSTVPTMIMAPPGFLILALKFNKLHNKTTSSSSEVAPK